MPPTSCRESSRTMAKRWETQPILKQELFFKLFVICLHTRLSLLFERFLFCVGAFQSHMVSVVKEDQLEGVYICFPSNLITENIVGWKLFPLTTKLQIKTAFIFGSLLEESTARSVIYLFIFLFCYRRSGSIWPQVSYFADFKSKMSLIVSVHVYSVQKALLKDSGPLYSVDYDAMKDNLNCSRCVDFFLCA